MNRGVKGIIGAAVYLAAIAGLSALFITVGPMGTAPGTVRAAQIPAYQPPAAVYREELTDLGRWAADPVQGGWIAPGGAARFIVTRALAYQKDLAAYAQANVGSIEMGRIQVLSEMAQGTIGGRETYVFEYADLEQDPVQYRKIYLLNTPDHTYGAMGVAQSREVLEQIHFDAIVANYPFQ